MRLLKFIIWLAVLLPILLIGALVFSLEQQPLVGMQKPLTPAQVDSARRLWQAHDPRRAREGELRSISLNMAELNLIANYGLNLVGGSASVTAEEGQLDIKATIKLPKAPLGQYLNLTLGLREARVLPQVRYFKAGWLQLPAKAADFALNKLLDWLYTQPGYGFAKDAIERVRIEDRMVSVNYRWSSKIAEAVRSSFLSTTDQKRLQLFHFQLASIVNGMNPGRRVTLEKLIGPLFRYAGDLADKSDPIADNRAAILVLSAYLNGRSLDRLAPDIEEWAHIKRRRVVLHGRKDLPQHFMVSAALAVMGGAVISQTAGLFKEIDDSRHGSGFSFSDLFADSAGTRFGEIAVASEARAKRLQKQLSGPLEEDNLIPKSTDLPDNLTESDFKQRYGEIGSTAYQQVVKKIEERVAAIPLYKE